MFGDRGHRLGGGSYDPAPGHEFEGCDCDPVDNPGLLAGALGCLLLIGVVAVMSLGTVPPLSMGIRYNGFTKAADTGTVYGPGRYFLGPFNKFMLFPSTAQTVQFSDEMGLPSTGARYEALHTRTKDGLGLHLQVSLQYRLAKDTLGDLYSEFNMNYEPVITSSVRDTLIRAASEYEATQLWEDREQFGDRMQQMVNRELKKAYAECWGLQLMLIDLPDVFEHRIVVTQIQKQNMLIKEQEQLSTQIRAQTSVIEAEFNKQVRIIMADGQANYTVTTREAHAEAMQNKIDAESEILGSLKSSLELLPEDLVLYQRYGALDDLEDASLLFGFSGPSSVLLKGGT
mmetsp:Transcript_26202/g.75150  ORF Transcript_26202/g.75150 Transcript_26202/m.75150 type:complete len:343 (-) Transcript_26202:198-1226(-)